MDDTRILVVEDDADINEVVCERLGRDGYACVSAYSGSEARPRVCRRAESAGGLRAAASDGGHTVLAIGRWSLDIDAHTFRIDDEPVSLTNIEFAIVELLMGHPNTGSSRPNSPAGPVASAITRRTLCSPLCWRRGTRWL